MSKPDFTSKKPAKGKSFLSSKGKTVYIGNLRYDLDEKAIFGIFGKFGRVKYVKLVKTPGSEQSKGIAFVDMIRAKDADKAIEVLNGRVIGGRTIKASEAKPQDIREAKSKKGATVASDKKRGFNKDEIIAKKKAKRAKGLSLLKNLQK